MKLTADKTTVLIAGFDLEEVGRIVRRHGLNPINVGSDSEGVSIEVPPPEGSEEIEQIREADMELSHFNPMWFDSDGNDLAPYLE